MRKLKIVYVDRLPRQPEDLPPDLVEVYIGLSRKGLELDIVRNGFLAAENVKHAIQRHIRQLDARNQRSDQPLAVRVGLYPTVNQEWRVFLDNLLAAGRFLGVPGPCRRGVQHKLTAAACFLFDTRWALAPKRSAA